jgi:hypothetical protein
MTFGSPPPYPPPRNPGLTVVWIALAVVAVALPSGLLVAVALGDDRDQAPGPAVTITASVPPPPEPPTPTPTPTTDPLTEGMIEYTWNDSTEKEKDDICFSIDYFGADWFADEMRERDIGQLDGGVDIDVDLTAQLLEEKCAQRSD